MEIFCHGKRTRVEIQDIKRFKDASNIKTIILFKKIKHCSSQFTYCQKTGNFHRNDEKCNQLEIKESDVGCPGIYNDCGSNGNGKIYHFKAIICKN